MSLPRFFLDEQVIAEEVDSEFELRLARDDMKHFKVLRLQPGEHIAVIDAASDYFECQITSVGSEVKVRIAQHEASSGKRPHVMLVQGLCKGDKMDDVIRHATELGVGSFLPLICERSVVKLDAKKTASRMQRWRSIAKSAAMQSGQPAIPQVWEPMKASQATQVLAECGAVLVCWEEERMLNLHDALAQALEDSGIDPQDARIAVVIGPEGGLSEDEVESLRGSNAHSYAITLGKSILRTETAGIVAPALLLYELGGLQ
ncbi:MAG: RsmE family RNA methyltransferase [Eggerthellaceae bacterium]